MAHPPPPTRGLRHVALRCSDLSAMETFYVDLMGYRIEWKPDPENSYLTNGCDSLALHVEPAAATQGPDSRLDHIGVLVRTEADVDDWAAFLGERSVRVVALPRTHRDGCRSCYVLDPEGNKIQILFHPALSSAP